MSVEPAAVRRRRAGQPAVPPVRPWRRSMLGSDPRDRRCLRHRPDRAGDVGPPGRAPDLAGRARDRDRRVPAAHLPGRPRPGPQPPDQQVDLEALEADLPVARPPVGLRHGVPARPHRRASCSTRMPGSASAGRSSRACRPTAARRSRSGRWRCTRSWSRPSRPLHEAPAGRDVAVDPPARARRVGPGLAPRDARRHRLATRSRPMYVASGLAVVAAGAYRYWASRKAARRSPQQTGGFTMSIAITADPPHPDRRRRRRVARARVRRDPGCRPPGPPTAAPLTRTPVSAETLQARLAEEWLAPPTLLTGWPR